jgi:CrcB protein
VSGVLVWLGVGVLGGVGAVARFTVDGLVSARAGRAFPFGILAVNLSGALALGILSGLALSDHAALLAGTALIGAYTTFSTWMLDTHRLAEEGRGGAALLNVAVSLVAGLGAAALGRALA